MQITAGAADYVRADVTGSRKYKVDVRIDGDEVVVDCDCPYFQGKEICKHVWATLLAAESIGYLNQVASAWHPDIRASFDQEGGESYDFTEPEPETPRQWPHS